jgi:hypothetical protein
MVAELLHSLLAVLPARTTWPVSASFACQILTKPTRLWQVNEDITSEILCLAETGPFAVPLECRIRRAKLSIPTPVVDLGVASGTVLGDTSTGSFTIVNSGALDVTFTVESVEVCHLMSRPGCSRDGSHCYCGRMRTKVWLAWMGSYRTASRRLPNRDSSSAAQKAWSLAMVK